MWGIAAPPRRDASAGHFLKTKPIPRKLKNDAIIEALFEIRFDMESVPELLYGRLADHSGWRSLEQRRLPAYDIPAPMRQVDENLRYQPVFELNDSARNSSIRIGPQVLSFHQRQPYGSWSTFRPKVEEAVDQLFGKAHNVKVRRLGLRYINALCSDPHNVRGVADLDLQITFSGEEISEKLNLNFTRSVSADSSCTVRVATPDYVQGVYPKETSVVVDVDVFTAPRFLATDKRVVKRWLKTAHGAEKYYFFALLKENTIIDLRED
jgi:uncharacterized protein (TIGR04255 family)